MEEYDNKTLNEVLEKVSPPFEVGLYDEYSNHSMEASNLSLYEAKIMVQSQRTIRMAKVKVIDGEDYDQCDETLAERAYSHDGKEFLIPVNFPGKIKVLKRCPSDVTKPPARFRKKHENVTKISSGQPSGSHDAAESSYETLQTLAEEEDADFTSQYEQPIPAYETYHETPNDSATRYRHLYTESSAATTTTYMSTKFVDISQEDRESIVQPGKTNEDFYKLSVLHLSFLLDYCTLPTLAEECYKRKFDGEFFRSISIDDIELKSLSWELA
ncbi:hypothetical protein MAR_037375 [Mya arenaria]|uniref:Uncharacterized protein n=1 Tax=Mya arenaria TaxID=6604 RepID=A0ABY7FSL1_MYAAR|nr:hypothetical protein MAR_037375 [Mya arenaria]